MEDVKAKTTVVSPAEMAARGVGVEEWMRAVYGESEITGPAVRVKWHDGMTVSSCRMVIYEDGGGRYLEVPAYGLCVLVRARVYLDCCGSTNPEGRKINGEAMDECVELLERAGLDLTSIRKFNEAVSYFSDLVNADSDMLGDIDRLAMRMLGDVIGAYDEPYGWDLLAKAVGLLYGWALDGLTGKEG